MHAQDAAKLFHDWAVAEGFIPDSPLPTESLTPEQSALIEPMTAVGRQILRTRQVQSVLFNESANRIIVLTKKAAPVTKRQLEKLPKAVDDIEVVYRQGVTNPIGGPPSAPFGGPAYVVRHVGGGDRYTCGSSISVGNIRDAGTLCCLVRSVTGELYGLSNNHVSGSCSFAGVGLPILAPGVHDVSPGGMPPFTIGFHAVSLAMIAGSADNVDATKNMDAAIFKIASPNLVSSFQGNAYDTPSTATAMVGGLEVEKYGRTTGLTKGRVLGQVNGPHPIRYNSPVYSFSGDVSFEPVFAIVGLTDAFSDAGDSGALITTVDASGLRTAVGIVVGGMNDGTAPGGKLTIALPIGPTLQALDVTLVSGHNA